jgi:hypothetical protein
MEGEAMTTPITKEQLIARIETQKEAALKHPECSVALMDLEIANIARAAMDAEPVADVVAWHKEGEERTCDIRWRRFDVEPGPLFAVAQPAAVVPDEMEPTVEAIKRVLPTSNPDEYAACIGADMWNACRAAMLNHPENERGMVEPVSQPYKLRATRFQQVADLYGILVPGGRTTTYSTDAAEASDCRVMGWSVQEYVKLERLQDALTGNSPVIPDRLNVRAVAALREAVRNQWLKSEDFADKVYWKSMHDIANEIVSAMLAAVPQQEE